jgi:predicted metal-binding membrane protein
LIGPAPRLFQAVMALLFVSSAALTLAWCGSMSSMPGMDMPGGWTMSMAWMRMPGQSWPGTAAAFLGMWIVMMVAMMLPALSPMLWRQSGPLTALVGLGYFAVWTLTGVIAFPLGVALAEAEMRSAALSRAVPVAGGVLIVLSGLLQLSRWKARQLECCRGAGEHAGAASASAKEAWRHGMRLGLLCFRCCAPMTAVLFVAGVMDLRVMAACGAAITLERLAPRGLYTARLMGYATILTGSIYLARG